MDTYIIAERSYGGEYWSDYHTGKGRWTPARDEATEYDSVDDGMAEGRRSCGARSWVLLFADTETVACAEVDGDG